jgi:hypothetical protein
VFGEFIKATRRSQLLERGHDRYTRRQILNVLMLLSTLALDMGSFVFYRGTCRTTH